MTDAPHPTPAPDATGADERPSIGRAVGKAAGLLSSEGFGNGERAALRRISPSRPFTPALWKVLYQFSQQDPYGWFRRDARRDERQRDWERRWATLLMGLAFCAEPGRNLHEYNVPLGRALFEAGWSELRFVRLLRVSGEALEVELRRVAQYLASKAQPANWADVADLLFSQPDDPSPKARELAEKRRLSIARAYYGARYAAAQEQGE